MRTVAYPLGVQELNIGIVVDHNAGRHDRKVLGWTEYQR